MFFVSTPYRNRDQAKSSRRFLSWLVLGLWALTLAAQALPARLVLALDGVSYRDLKALQSTAGVTATNFCGHTYQRRAFTADEGYFPVSRMISTFPSASDVAWTDIFGDRPLPGYQRTYYSAAANSMISINGVTTTMEHERQMDWQVENGFIRAMGYLFSAHIYQYELHGMEVNFWKTKRNARDYYVYVRASDDAQHLDRDIMALLCQLDQKLQKMRARYKAQTGRDLEIVILSDHGHNHAGRGIRVDDAAFLKKAGYNISQTISGPKDVVLPICGIESWIEIHNDPGETEKLAQLLRHLTGVDLITAVVPNQTNRFLVMNPQGERADILWDMERNAFRYLPQTGDPLHYNAVVNTLSRQHQLDANGYASADDWMAATMTNYYPLALERIARGLKRCTLNPATILISLDNRYVNDGWLTEKGSRLVTCRSTHGGLDEICSDGIVLCNFKQPQDTSTERVAAQFDHFWDVKDFRAEETGAELFTRDEQSLVRIKRLPLDNECTNLMASGNYLRIWSPVLTNLDAQIPLKITVRKVPQFSTSSGPWHLTLNQPLTLPEDRANERIYKFPADLKLEPESAYEITGSIRAHGSTTFDFPFHTDKDGQPVAY